MAHSHFHRAPDRLGSKVSTDSSVIDFLCSICSFPVVRARQIGCGCRICEPCYLHLHQEKSRARTEAVCNKCLQVFDIQQTFRDKASDNEINRKTFPCFHVHCSWYGSAYEYRDHIECCEFADVQCSIPGCDRIITRKTQKQHEAVCQFRLISCQWCKKLIKLNEKQQHEYTSCEEFVLNCPAGCGETIERKNVRDHSDYHCKKQTRPCLFMRYGCKTKGTFDKLEKHKREHQAAHLEMLAKFMNDSNMLESDSAGVTSNKQLSSEKKCGQLQAEIQAVRKEMDSQLKQIQENIAKFDTMLQDMQAGFQELAVLVQTLQATSYNGTFVWKIPEIWRRAGEAMNGKTLSLYSAPFFTSRFGYKLCLRLYLNGDGSGKGTHISFFLTIMKGEYDALLPWPFAQTVTLMLLDQNKKNHVTQCFKPEPTSSSFWKPHSEMNIASGCPKFAPISVLNDLNYVQEDTMYFKVVIDLAGLSQP